MLPDIEFQYLLIYSLESPGAFWSHLVTKEEYLESCISRLIKLFNPGVMEMADISDLKSDAEKHEGSSPSSGIPSK